MLSNRISSNCSKIWPVNPQWLCSFQFFMSSSFAMCSQIEGRYDSSLSLTTCCWLEGFLQKMQPSSGPWVLGEISEQLKKRQSSRVPLASLLLCSLKQPYVCLLASWCQKQQWWLKTQIFHFSHSTSWKSTLKDNLCWGIFQGFVMFESRTWERIQFMYTDRSSSSKYSKFSSKLVFLILQIVFKTQQWISIDQFYIF